MAVFGHLLYYATGHNNDLTLLLLPFGAPCAGLTAFLLMVRGRRSLRVRPLTANFSLLAVATLR